MTYGDDSLLLMTGNNGVPYVTRVLSPVPVNMAPGTAVLGLVRLGDDAYTAWTTGSPLWNTLFSRMTLYSAFDRCDRVSSTRRIGVSCRRWSARVPSRVA